MLKPILLLLFVALLTLSAQQTLGQSRYSIRLFNCDDSCSAELNGGFIAGTGFANDSGWLDITDALEDGTNHLKFTVTNESRGIAYGFQVRKNDATVFDQTCGRAGVIGCNNNRIFPNGIARTFAFEILRPPADRPASYTDWLAFLRDLRAALGRRDRIALRSMIRIPFDTQEGQLRSFDAVMKFLDADMTRELQREIAPGAKFTFSQARRPMRSSVNGIFEFELGNDGRWRLCCQSENEEAGEEPSPQISTQPASPWEGTYSFDEVVRRGGGNAGNIGYTIIVRRNGNSLVADLEVEGWQTSDRLKCEARVEGNRLRLYLWGFGDDDSTGKFKYKLGALLLTLEKDNTRTLTYWGAFKPLSNANQESGRVYFKREP